MENRKEEQERKAFQDDIKYFLSKEQFNLHDFHERVLVSPLFPYNTNHTRTGIHQVQEWFEDDVHERR